MSPLQIVLGRLAKWRQTRENQYLARCPAHDDKVESLSLTENAKGVALNCFAGCPPERIVAAIGLTMKDLFRFQFETKRRAARPTEPLTLTALAAHFRLDEGMLAVNGVEETASGVLIRYLDEQGQSAGRERERRALHGKDRFRWRPGEAAILPYGLQFIPKWREREPEPYLILVEGESDVWAGWTHDVPVLGLPSATMQKCLQRGHVEGFGRIYILREPDQGGDTFVALLPHRLAEIGWTGSVFELRLGATKDLADLHRENSDSFEALLQEAITSARPLQLPSVECHAGRKKRRARGEQGRAANKLLRQMLGNGEKVPVKMIQEAAREKGIAWMTLRRAAENLPIRKRPSGFGRGWVWHWVSASSPDSGNEREAA